MKSKRDRVLDVILGIGGHFNEVEIANLYDILNTLGIEARIEVYPDPPGKMAADAIRWYCAGGPQPGWLTGKEPTK